MGLGGAFGPLVAHSWQMVETAKRYVRTHRIAQLHPGVAHQLPGRGSYGQRGEIAAQQLPSWAGPSQMYPQTEMQ
jgi:hypothetical protein